MSKLTFTVPGRPRPQGSKKPFVNKHTGRVQLVESSAHLKDWRSLVAFVAAEKTVGWQFSCPVGINVIFVFCRPKSHFGTGRNAGVLKPGAPEWPDNRGTGDLDKLVRAVADAITGPLIVDDSLIATLAAKKVFGFPERAEITVASLSAQPLDYGSQAA